MESGGVEDHVFEEPDGAHEAGGEHQDHELLSSELRPMQLRAQHFHCAYRQESPCGDRQKNRLHEISERIDSPSESYRSSVKQCLSDDQSVGYLFAYIFVTIVDSHGQGVSPFMEGYRYGSTQEAADGVLNSNGDSFEDCMEVHGESEEVGVLVFLLDRGVLFCLGIAEEGVVGEQGLREGSFGSQRFVLVKLSMISVSPGAVAMSVFCVGAALVYWVFLVLMCLMCFLVGMLLFMLFLFILVIILMLLVMRVCGDDPRKEDSHQKSHHHQQICQRENIFTVVLLFEVSLDRISGLGQDVDYCYVNEKGASKGSSYGFKQFVSFEISHAEGEQADNNDDSNEKDDEDAFEDGEYSVLLHGLILLIGRNRFMIQKGGQAMDGRETICWNQGLRWILRFLGVQRSFWQDSG